MECRIFHLENIRSIPQCIKSPTNSNPKCSPTSIKWVEFGIVRKLAKEMKSETIPVNWVIVAPKRYKMLKNCGMVTINRTNIWDINLKISEPSLFAKGVHHNDIYLVSYKFFPVKEPLEFTLGFTERQNYMEVL